MYSPREREQRRIVDQRCKKLSHGLRVLDEKLTSVEDYSMIFKLHGKMRYNAKRMKDEGEPMWLSFKSMYASG